MTALANAYAPFDSGPGSNVTADTWRKMMRFVAGSGVFRQVLAGLQPYADSTGLQVKVKTGEAWVRGHWGEWTIEAVLPIAENTSGFTRLDLVIVRADFVNKRLELAVLTGVPSATPVPPPVTENTSIWECQLGIVTVPTGDLSIDPGQVVSARKFSGSKPIVHPLRAVSLTTAIPSGADGDLVAINFTTHSDCFPAVTVMVHAQADNGASGSLAEPCASLLGIRIKRVSDGVTVYSSDKVFPLECLDWSTPNIQGRGSVNIPVAANAALVRNTEYQVVVYGQRTTVLGAQIRHVIGHVTEVTLSE